MALAESPLRKPPKRAAIQRKLGLVPPKPVVGSELPRIAPTMPKPGRLDDYMLAAEKLRLKPYPWQKVAATYLTATDADNLWLYRDFAAVVSRRNGKTEFVLPRIVMALEDGVRVLHTAQDRALPRLTFEQLCDLINDEPELEAQVRSIRTANGTEAIKFNNGGRYTLLAPSHGVRGHHGDLVLEDEVREQHDYRLQRALGPTSLASKNPQRVRLSNAGDTDSVVLNDLRRRMDEGAPFCYLEWSADPDLDIDDRQGWLQANPALGHGLITMELLEDARRTQTPAGFETEHLCRWVVTMQPRLVAEAVWLAARAQLEPRVIRPMMAVSMDASGARASAAIAWQQTDGSIALRIVADVTGAPIDVDALGVDMRDLSLRLGVPSVGFDPLTDAALAKHFKDPKSIAGNEFANASATFVRLLNGGMLHWDDADALTDDLAWTARRPYEGLSGAWKATKAKEDRPVTAVLAAIRAVSLATGPKPSAPTVY